MFDTGLNQREKKSLNQMTIRFCLGVSWGALQRTPFLLPSAEEWGNGSPTDLNPAQSCKTVRVRLSPLPPLPDIIILTD